jgi:hypothetical protein
MKNVECIRKLEVFRLTMDEVKEAIKPPKLSIDICFVDLSKLTNIRNYCASG